jgi:uncharacterized protein (TIGR03032 family)
MKPGTESLVPSGTTVLVSGFDLALEGRGGLFAWDGHQLTKIDDVNTTGMRMHGDDLLRCAWNTERDHADLVVTGIDGRSRTARLDGVGNPHDILPDEGHLVAVVATEQNEIVWFRRDGRHMRTWRPESTAESDSWHLNSLVRHQGRLLVGAFGRFTQRKEWDLLGKPASGCIVDVDSGAVVLNGLRAPHTPRFVDGRWLVCNSADGELIAVDSEQQHTVLAKFDGWPRGLLVTPRAVFVGISPDRKDLRTAAATSRVVALDPTSWETLAEVEVAAREIYDLVLAPRTLIAAMSTASIRNRTSSKTGR